MGTSKRERVYHPLWELTLARLVEFVRNPGAVFWVFGFPVLLAIVLGIAFRNREPELPRAMVVGPGADSLVEKVGDAAGIELEAGTDEEGRESLRSARIDLLVVAGAGDSPALTYRYDPTRPDSRAVRLAVDDAVQRAFGRTDVATITEEKVEERGGRYIDFLLPGLIGLNIMGSGMWGIGYNVVDNRKRKLLKRFAATPMNRSHFLLSFMFSRMVFLVLEIAALLLFGWLIFDVHVYGSLVSVGVISILGALTFSGMAILVAARTDSTEVGAGWMNFIMLPMWVVSGAFFSYDRFPEYLHPAIRALPLTSINDALRMVMNHGESITAAWMELLLLAAWGIVSFVLALRFFRWQ